MKTTKQAAIDWVESESITKNVDEAERAFRAGKAFAEEWISFQDELPPFSKDKILLKREKVNSETMYELRKFNTGNKAHILSIYTHWRPINRK